jgi:hypothetical protein
LIRFPHHWRERIGHEYGSAAAAAVDKPAGRSTKPGH